MPGFVPISDPEEGDLVHWQYRAGNVSLIARMYAFGQYRFQVMYYREGYKYPDIIGPEF